jgi:hypothetical protein
VTQRPNLPFGTADVVALVDRVATEVARVVARRPIDVRLRPSVDGVVGGRLDEIEVEVRGFATTGLVVDRTRVRATRVGLRPGLPARLVADQLELTVTVGEAAVNRWLRTDLGPFRVHLEPDGGVVRTSVAGLTVNEVSTELAVDGRWLRLQPRRASVMGVPAPMSRLFRGYLPLPALPAGARLGRVEHGDREISVTVDLGQLDEPIDLGLTDRLARRIWLSDLHPPGPTGR